MASFIPHLGENFFHLRALHISAINYHLIFLSFTFHLFIYSNIKPLRNSYEEVKVKEIFF